MSLKTPDLLNPGEYLISNALSLPVLAPVVSLAPANMNLAKAAIGNMTLSIPFAAPAGGLVFNLSSSAPAVVGVPASVLLPAGANSTSFEAKGMSAGSSTLSAQAPGYQSTTATVTVYEVTLGLPNNVVIAPGGTRMISVTLSYPAPEAGLQVMLASSNTGVLTVPSSVTVPAGQTSATVLLNGATAGTAVLSATATGYEPASTTITVDTVTVSLGVSTISLLREGKAAYAVALSHPAPAGGVTIAFATGDPAIATVSPVSITIPEGQTTAGASKVTVNGVSEGSTTLTVTALGVQPLAIPISVSAEVSGVDLTIGGISIGTVVSHPNGTFTIPVTYTVSNIGTVAALPNWSERAYLSVDGVAGVDDQVLGSYHHQTQPLAAGASYTKTVEFTANAGTVPGNYTVFVKTDGHPQAEWPYGGTVLDGGNLKETDETNNMGSAGVVLVK